ncbi:gliding motility-associated C-terminal domain-containing protein [Flaviaesturariibacter amylovorans]|uniref:T9SS type B sorting domain-containing protein n=1 Tax=Flaviaesturariibacter amylovorans TaxID=1084520 RepID=A0ABP8GJ58_9BACT
MMVLLGSLARLGAQTDIQIGTGAAGNGPTTYPTPIADYFEGMRAQYLYRASELIAAGMSPGNITSLKWNVLTVNTDVDPGAPPIENFTIRIGTTATASLTNNTWETVTNTVYTNASYTNTTTGWNAFNFSAPFFWNGVDNIVVEVCHGDPGNAGADFWTSNTIVAWTTGLAFNGSHTRVADNLGNLCGTTVTTNTGTQTTRPNIIFTYTPAAACAGAPTGGTATSSTAVVCLGTPFTLTPSGTSLATGLTYQWQSSPNNMDPWTDIAGGDVYSFTTTQLTTTYYRLKVTCTNAGGSSSFSSSVLVTSPAAVSGTFTINNALPTGGTNFTSFNDAYNYIKCGISDDVIFNVAPGSGPYNERLEMIAVPGASSVNTVTFNGNGATIQSIGTGASRAVIRLDGADHITFNNLVITATSTAAADFGYGVQLLNNADSNTVANCTININTTNTNTNYAGIVMSGSATSATATGATQCDFNTFRNNTIIGGYYGITIVGSATEAVMNNRVLNNRIQDFYFYGVYLNGNFNTQVDSNVISRPTRATVSTFNGVYMTGLSTSVDITRNTFTNPYGGAPASTGTSYAVFMTGVDALGTLENVIANNLVYNITGTGDAYGFYNTSSDNVFYYHNTIVLDGTGSNTAVTRGFYQTTSAAGIEFRNNIVAISRGGNGTKTAIFFNTAASTIVSNRNDFYITSTGGINQVGSVGTTGAATLAAWQALSTQDANSVTTNPVFTDPLNGNFKPTSASVNDLGTPVGITNDILGVTRDPNFPDIGAYEFAPLPCTTPPTPGVAAVSTTPVCVNNSVQLSLSGNSTGLTQTYTWQTSPTGDPASFVSIGNALTNPDTTILSSTTLYYRVAVTCGPSTTFSTAVLLTVNPALPAGTYTINSAAPTVPLVNYTSFADAKAALACGITGSVVFNVLPGANAGIYNEQLVLNAVPGTSATSTITFNGNGNTLQFLSTTNDERATIKLNGTDYTTFNNLVIRALGTATTEYGYGVQLMNNADSNTFNGCQIFVNPTSTSLNFAGIVMSNSATSATTTGATLCDGNKFNNNTVTGGYYGITLVGSTTDAVQHNEVTNNRFVNFYAYGAYLTGNSNTLIRSNDFSNPGRTTVTTTYGIYATGLNTRLLIDKNRIHDIMKGAPTSTSVTYGIYFTGVDALAGLENIVSNNAIYEFYGNSDQYGIYNTSSDNVWYYHNTIALNDQTASYSTADWTRGFHQVTTATGLIFKNNNISITRSGQGTRQAVYLSTAATTIELNNNNYHVVGTPTTSYVGFNGANQLTLANWQAATGQDAASYALDPLFTSPATGDLSPRHPVLDNRGTPIAGITLDITNQARSLVTPDIGAFEFAIPACTTPPVAGAAAAVPNTGICMGARIALSVTGNSSGSGQTYQWEYSVTGAPGTWLPLGSSMMFPDTTIEASVSQFYRVAVTCSGNTTYSTSAQVTLNPAFLGGVYTINPALPAALPNFQSFATAVAAMECGITDDVTFLVAPGTYTEQIRIRNIAGTSPNDRVTFKAANGIPSSVTLTNAGTATANYTLQLDSASYITFRDMTIAGTNSTNGRVIELANTASNDSLHNLIISAPVATGTGTGVVGIYSGNLRGGNHVIDSNSISNGVSGIYIVGVTGFQPNGIKVSNNTVNGAHYYGIYLGTQWNTQVIANTVNRAAPMNATNYAIFLTNVDSNYQVQRNVINLDGVTGTGYGLYLTLCDARLNDTARVTSNVIKALTGNTGTLYGMYQNASTNNYSMNNVIVLSTTGTTSHGLYSTGGSNNHYYNNSVHNLSPNGTANNAAYFNHSGGTFGPVDIRNNVFAHSGGGRAMEVANGNNIYSDYNLLYTSGATLVRAGANNRATLADWQGNEYWDLTSIVIKPEFVSNTDLRPDVNVANVWAMHGRGVQIPASWYDFNGAPRPTTLTTGVPDLGAYEFFPAVAPPALTPTPAVAAPGTSQYFMFGTDTVSRVTWNANSTVPTTMTLRRYSGVLPTGLAPTDRSMYYYNQMETTGGGTSNFNLKNFYVESWLGFIPAEGFIRTGRTNNTGTWIMEERTTLDTLTNWYNRDSLSYMDRFTGLMGNALIANPGGIYQVQVDSSNRGKRFWVAYQRGYDFFSGSNNQNMLLYLGTDAQPATVTVKVKGTSWVRTYNIPAFTAITSDRIPKGGMIDARLLAEGLYGRGISIESDVPITAYAHIYNGSNSGASMLLPVGTYGYEYYTLSSRQYYSSDNNSVFYVIADRDNTTIEITPANPTTTGRPAGVPFTVTLNAGDVYQVLGATIDGSNGYDMTGSKVKSLPNADGKCWPIAVFAGSTRTAISCGNSTGSNGDVIMQQVFPYQAWGKSFLTAPTSQGTAASSFMTNIYRILVKDATTQVQVNGAPIAVPLQNGRFYQLESADALQITTDKPVLLAQFMASSGSTCPGNTGDGDPEMFYLSPVEQAVKYAAFYRNDEFNIDQNYLTLVIPNGGLATLSIDGVLHSAGGFDHTYAHFRPGYSVVIKRWAGTAGQSIVRSDSAFTGIVYGTGSVESYGYNVGTLVKNLNGVPSITNTLASIPGNSPYTCARAPFQFTIQVPVQPTSITWQFSAVPGMQPNQDVVQNNPIPSGTVMIGGQMFYQYTVPTNYVVNNAGTYLVPIRYTHPEIEGCNNTAETTYPLSVREAPQVDFNNNQAICAGSPITMTGAVLTSATPANTWAWTINNGTPATATTQTVTANFPAAGTYNVSLRVTSTDGCVGDTTKQVTISPLPTLAITVDTVQVCAPAPAVFTIQNPDAGLTYSWYTTLSGGTAIATGTTFTAPAGTGSVYYYVEASNGVCTSQRKIVKAEQNTAPVVTVANANLSVCSGTPATFTIQNPVAGATYSWFSAATGGTALATGTAYTPTVTTGTSTFYVEGTSNGCTSSPRVPVTVAVTAAPAVTLVEDTIGVCAGTAAIFQIQNPAAGATYTWYSAATGGTVLSTGTSFTAPATTGSVTYYVESSLNGCTSNPRTPIVARLTVPLPTPVVTAQNIGVDSIRFKWNPVPGAASYEVSLNNSGVWTVPSTGPTGLSHLVTGLTPLQLVTLNVRALGTTACETSGIGNFAERTLGDNIFIPNSFTPNGDGLNDVLRVYGGGIREMRFYVFNQWGEKVHESTDPTRAWDGTVKGKAQPSGVYMYVSRIVLANGNVLERKGSINLIR